MREHICRPLSNDYGDDTYDVHIILFYLNFIIYSVATQRSRRVPSTVQIVQTHRRGPPIVNNIYIFFFRKTYVKNNRRLYSQFYFGILRVVWNWSIKKQKLRRKITYYIILEYYVNQPWTLYVGRVFNILIQNDSIIICITAFTYVRKFRIYVNWHFNEFIIWKWLYNSREPLTKKNSNTYLHSNIQDTFTYEFEVIRLNILLFFCFDFNCGLLCT